LLYQEQPISRATNELMHSINTINKEVRCLKEKFLSTADLIDHRARENIKGVKRTEVAMKYYYGMNHYEKHESNINRGKTKAEYPHYSKRES